MLGIQPGGNSSGMGMSAAGSVGSIHRDTPPGSPRTPLEPADSEERRDGRGSGGDSPHEKLRKHHSFRLSFKRREHGSGERERGGSERGSRRGVEHRSDSTSGYPSSAPPSSTPPYTSSSAVPAKFIRATSVKAHTLNPRWNEKFRFDIDDVASDILHLDIWDHDDESSVLEAVSKLNEVRGVKGLGRFFKQIAQSARLGGGGGQDDFLGCVNIPLQDIPSTGLERWYELEARTCRSSVQGRIRLRLWLSTREDRGTSEEEDDHWAQSRRQATLTHLLLSHQLRIHRGPPCEWGGELPPVAQAILHQHAIQGDVSELQATAGRWLALCRLSMAPASTPVRRAPPHASLLQERPARKLPPTHNRGGSSGATLHAHNQQHGPPGMASGRRSPKPRPRRGGSRRGAGGGSRRRGRGAGRRRGAANSEVHRDSIDLRLALKALQQLEMKWGNTEPLSREEEECLAESFNAFIDFGLKLVRRHRQIFNPRDRLALCRLDALLRCLGFMSSMKAFWKVCPFNKEIRGEVIASLRKGTVEWYEEIRNRTQSSVSPLEGLVNLITYMLVDLQKGIDYYASMFESTNGIPYFGVVYKQLDKLIHADIGSKVAEVCAQMRAGMEMQEDQQMAIQGSNIPTISAPLHQFTSFDIGTPIFELHLAMQEFVLFREHLASQERRALAVNNYHEWFEPALEKWLHVAKYKAMLRVRRACEQATPLNGTTANGSDTPPHSTSAIDCVSCFHQIEEFWRQLSWPDPISAYSHLCSIVDIICSAAEYFSDLTNQKLQETGFYEDPGPYKFNVEMCMVANDLEMVLRCVSTLRDNLGMAPVMAAVESAASQQQHQHHQQYGGMNDIGTANTTGPDYRGALYNPIEAMQAHLEGMLTRIIGRMGVQLRQPLEKATFHLAWSPESLPTKEAMAPLFRLLRSALSPLSTALLPPNFTRALLATWDAIQAQIRRQMEASATSGDKLSSFYNRLSEALAILAHYFSNGDNGRWDAEDGPTRAVGPPPPPLTPQLLATPSYSSTRQLLSYHVSSTQQLIDMYHAERLRLQQQIMASGSVSSETERAEYGTLTVRAYFNHDSLCVEVLSARDIIPLDPNGFSDPFVIIELLPRAIFSHCSEQRTSVQKKTLNPLFDECFEFSVSLEQCHMEGAMLLFTVMDHDVLTANDFAGEAFLSLGDIPGVSSANATVDNFHGLKHTDLPLMHQKNKHHPILQILEMRHSEKMAQEFVKKQKPRITS
ncbi:BAI1-associated protein 3-like [Ischnura elegans]|uniref:BAI1-associated protein 3-like n=1 Tax=Ischnura elegans TaxID=197161 RepID=UPI001ED87E4A|nr:BAI1-associated protein 3-like [Ischnura elegans]